MCGILGVCEEGGSSRSVLERMMSVMKHRGPDDEGVKILGDHSLAHVRLSIIDLESGDQPMSSRDGKLTIAFNGEIYNYRELRRELKGMGHDFRTHSDTEVLLEAYRAWGTGSFRRLNGIFAFIIYDHDHRRFVLVRDHFGVKPLHYYHDGGIFAAASEQKSILAHPKVKRQVNWVSFHEHLNLRYTPGEETLFAGIKRLAPGHFLILEENRLRIERYYRLEARPDHRMTEEEAVEGLHVHLKEAVRRQLVSDVPLGVYLSGGMDSSAIVQKMRELDTDVIKTFTLGFNEPTDEFPDAEIIARKFETEHHTHSLAMEPLKLFPEVIWHAEESKINLLQGFNMSAFVKPHVTVVLGGLGGDELLGGYDIHRLLYPVNRLNRFVPDWMKKIGSWKSDIIHGLQTRYGSMATDEYRRALQAALALGDIEKQYLILRNVWDHDSRTMRMIYAPSFLGQLGNDYEGTRRHFEGYFRETVDLDSVDQVLFTEFHTKMVNDYLLTEDRMSMSHGVEERVPFLDPDLVNFGFSIPLHLKMKGGKTKALFRKAMEGYLPEHIIYKKKWGFTVNPYLQFKKDLGAVAERILTRERVEAEGIFNYSYIRRILDAKPDPRLRWHYNLLWIMTGLMIWKNMFIDSDRFLKRDFELGSYEA